MVLLKVTCANLTNYLQLKKCILDQGNIVVLINMDFSKVEEIQNNKLEIVEDQSVTGNTCSVTVGKMCIQQDWQGPF